MMFQEAIRYLYQYYSKSATTSFTYLTCNRNTYLSSTRSISRALAKKTRSTRHKKTCFTIANALTKCMRLAFPGWDEDITTWGFKVVEDIPQQLNSDDCGFFVLEFMRQNTGGLIRVKMRFPDAHYLTKAK